MMMQIEIPKTVDYGTNRAGISRKQPKLVKWEYPRRGTWKLNTDGSCRGNPGPGGVGGILRDENGQWLLGYMGRIDHCTSLFAELSSIRCAVQLVHGLYYNKISVETDCKVAVEMIKNKKRLIGCIRENNPISNLVEDCRVLLKLNGSDIRHVYREGNSCADFLAKEGVGLAKEFVALDEPPQKIIPFMLADFFGTTYVRYT